MERYFRLEGHYLASRGSAGNFYPYQTVMIDTFSCISSFIYLKKKVHNVAQHPQVSHITRSRFFLHIIIILFKEKHTKCSPTRTGKSHDPVQISQSYTAWCKMELSLISENGRKPHQVTMREKTLSYVKITDFLHICLIHFVPSGKYATCFVLILKNKIWFCLMKTCYLLYLVGYLGLSATKVIAFVL